MKVLRAIGGFFAKIGRWIANTAWIQPLLIVGGIFGIIFSIPYIKDAIEKAQIDNTDYDYAWYSANALDLEKDGRADKLLGYLENDNTSDIKNEFGSQFFLTFVEESCDYCKECVDGYKEFAAKFSSFGLENEFKIYTILVDKKDSNDKYLAKQRFDDHKEFFDDLVATFADNRGSDEYVLYKTAPSKASDIKTKLEKLLEATSSVDGKIDTPFTLMFDYNIATSNTRANVSGVSAVFFNYVDLVTADVKNQYTKSLLLRDCWSYQNIFDPDWEDAGN